jgi:crotonobetainyl-CoA:carnitine CoA-transferase CaiB-like acyl-CoA transferase
MNSEVPGQEGNNHPTLSPMGVFDTSDGIMNIAASTDKMFKAFCDALEAEELAGNDDYASVEGRLNHREDLWKEINSVTSQHPTAELVEKLNSFGIPCGPINDIQQAFIDEQVKFLAMTKTAHHDQLGDFDLLRSPINLSNYEHGVRFERPGPDLGEHSVEILRELDYSEERIDEIVESGAVKIGIGK